MLPTDPKIRNLSPFQSLWLCSQIMKDKKGDRDYIYNMVKLVASIANPDVAKKAFSEEGVLKIDNENFENDLKGIDPDFNMDNVKDIIGDD